MKPRKHRPRPFTPRGEYLDPAPRKAGSISRTRPLLVEFNADNTTQRPVFGSGAVYVARRGGP